jgi:hypothetical protein
MKFSLAIILAFAATEAAAFTPSGAGSTNNNLNAVKTEPETKVVVKQPVLDPLDLYPSDAAVDVNVDMSMALPFVTRPLHLDRTLAGDVGFDPLGIASSKKDLLNLREAELKHGRMAMLAAIGWPLSELWDKQLSVMVGLKPLLGVGDRVPSVLNGGLENTSPVFWAIVLILATAIDGAPQAYKEKVEFDPFGFVERFDQKKMELAEIKHSRLAMLAITGFAIQEFVTKVAVVQETPFFFHPL